MEKDKIAVKQLILIGGSAGSLEVLLKIIPQLPDSISFPIVIILHRKSAEDTILEDLIAIKSAVPVMQVEDKVQLLPGYIYVAPSNYHLLFERDGCLSLDNSEKVNYSRPSIDVAFESAADVYGSKVSGILLSGANSDGTNGLIAISRAGGKVVIQKPETAGMPFMPENAISHITPDYIFDVEEIVSYLNNANG